MMIFVYQHCFMQTMGCCWLDRAVIMIRLVMEVAGKCGLNINKGKSNVLLYNCKGGHPERVGGIGVLGTWGLIWIVVCSVLVHIRGEVGSGRENGKFGVFCCIQVM